MAKIELEVGQVWVTDSPSSAWKSRKITCIRPLWERNYQLAVIGPDLCMLTGSFRAWVRRHNAQVKEG